jgi:hypothetical protein
MVYYVLYMQMRGKLYTSRRNGSNKVLYILPSACFATFLAVVRAKIVRGTCFFCYVRPPKSGKNCLEKKKLKKLPTPIASPDSPEFFSDLSEMPLGNFTRIGQHYAPIT